METLDSQIWPLIICKDSQVSHTPFEVLLKVWYNRTPHLFFRLSAFGICSLLFAISTREGIGWLSSRPALNQTLSICRVPLFHLFIACDWYFLFGLLFLCCCVFDALIGACRCSSDLFLSSRPRTVPDWQPRILLGMVEARSVNVKNTTTTATATYRT